MNDVRPAYQRFKIGEATHPGNTGKNNEDSYGYIVSPVRDNKSGQLLLAVVADGIGGEIAGEEAAQLAVKTIKDSIIANSSAADLSQTLTKAVQNANTAVYKRSQESDLFANMGTTAAVIAVSDDQLYVANVGDSRIYLIRGGAITQLSTDHSWGQEALEAGRISRAEARQHPNRNVLMRYLGVSREVDVDLRIRAVGRAPAQHDTYVDAPLFLEPHDALLLCSDGLTDMVSDREICAAVVKNPSQQAADRLVEIARRRGGLDNITVLILKSHDVAVAGWTPRRRLILSAAVLLLLSTLGLAAHNWFAAQSGPTTAHASNVSTTEPVPVITPTATTVERKPAVAPPDGDPDISVATTPLSKASRTPFPTATAVPTWTPAPTSTPTPTPTPTSPPTPIVQPTSAGNASASPAPQGTPALALDSPPPNDTQQRTVTFSWRALKPLSQGTGYEVVWWGSGEDPDTAAQGFAPPLTDTSLTVNLDPSIGKRSIYWAVLLVNIDPYARLTKPSSVEARPLNVQVCTVHEKCRTCQESYVDPKTGETKTRSVRCDCKTVCD
jgi:PPM family protein phosphatase